MRRCQPWLGTYVEIRAEGLPPTELQKAIDDAFTAIQYIHRLMSFHDQMSDVSALNQEAHHTPLKVHSWTYQVLAQGMTLHQATNGLFDYTIAPRLMKWNYLPAVDDWKTRTGTMADIELLEDSYVRFHCPLAIDLGGIAKGFAVDQAISTLQRAGVRQAVVNAGGDLRVWGDRLETITVRHPHDPTQLLTIGQINDGAVATSALYFSANDTNETGSPLVDPRTGNAIQTKSSYTVIAESCMIADGLTKALAIEGDIHAPYLTSFQAEGIIV
jgi:FAD:protein FMN transferase